jgi:hypothetical protein
MSTNQHPLTLALASVFVAVWRATGRQVKNKAGKEKAEYAIAVPAGKQKSGDTVCVYKARTGELALFTLGELGYKRTENGVTEHLFVNNTALNPQTGAPLTASGSGATVTEA